MNKEPQILYGVFSEGMDSTYMNCRATAALTHSALPNGKHGSRWDKTGTVSATAIPNSH